MPSDNSNGNIYIHTYIYIHMYVYVCMYTYIYIYIFYTPAPPGSDFWDCDGNIIETNAFIRHPLWVVVVVVLYNYHCSFFFSFLCIVSFLLFFYQICLYSSIRATRSTKPFLVLPFLLALPLLSYVIIISNSIISIRTIMFHWVWLARNDPAASD